MDDECAEAISVANHYFVLADNMAFGFKDYLAEDVVLKWFGRNIQGKGNVAAFVLSNEIQSFHKFSNIIPISGINYKQSKRKKKQTLNKNDNVKEANVETTNCSGETLAGSSHEIEMSTTCENVIDFNRKQESDASNAALVEKNDNIHVSNIAERINALTVCNDVNTNVNHNQVSANAIAEMDDQSYDDLNENDLRNLFEPEITSQTFVGNTQNINRIKLKEEMAPTIRAINRECGRGDEPVIAEARTTKYLEATGEIKFMRKNTSLDSSLSYHWSRVWKQKMWKRQCKMQIAYSCLIDNKSPKIAKSVSRKSNTTLNNAHSTCQLSTATHRDAHRIEQRSKLPSLEETIQTCNSLIPDINYFDGYLKPINFTEDRKHFLKHFEAEMTQKNPNVQCCAEYLKNKLILHFPNKRSFNAKYRIHAIIYETENSNERTVKEWTGAK